MTAIHHMITTLQMIRELSQADKVLKSMGMWTCDP